MAQSTDAAAILDIYAYYIRDTPISFETEVPALDAFSLRLEAILGTYPYILCEQEGRCLGYAYASPQMERAAYQWNATLSVYLHREHTGRGLGSALYTRLIALVQLQNLHNVYGGVTTPNPACEKLHTRLGFTRLGVYRDTGYKFGRWHDVTWYEKRIASLDTAPVAPLPFRRTDPFLIAEILRDPPAI